MLSRYSRHYAITKVKTVKLQIKSKIPLIYLIFAFLLLLYVFYQNIVLGKGSDSNYY